MKILVTGGAGFIGSHIVDAYIKAGHRVTVIDNLLNGARKNVNRHARFFNADITNYSALHAIFKKELPDTVNHHAALISVADSIKNPLEMHRVNVQGTENVFRAFGETMQKRGKIIFPSSAAVYGNALHIPTPERAPLLPLSPYGTSKVLGEKAVRAMSKRYGLSYTILRYANVYGARQNALTGGVIAKIQALVESGKQPVLYGKGTNTRDYTYVEDIARANILALTSGANEILNIATGIPTTDTALLRLIFEALNYTGSTIKKPARKGDIAISALNPNRAKKILGWMPTTSLRAGLIKTISS
jgi:UDP-glucose 4-epimerase